MTELSNLTSIVTTRCSQDKKTSEYPLRMSRPGYCIKGPSNEIGSKSTKYHVY